MEFNAKQQISMYRDLCSLKSTTYEIKIEGLKALMAATNKADIIDKTEIQCFLKNEIELLKKEKEETEIINSINNSVKLKYKEIAIKGYSIDSELYNKLNDTSKQQINCINSNIFSKYNELIAQTNQFLNKANELLQREKINATNFNTLISLAIEAETNEQIFALKQINPLTINKTSVINLNKKKYEARNNLIKNIELNFLRAKNNKIVIEGNNQNEGGNSGNNGRGGTKISAQKQLVNPIMVETKPVFGKFTQAFSGPEKQIERQIQ